MNKFLLLLSLVFSLSALADLPTGSFEGRTRKNIGCYYKYDGKTLVFGYQPNDRPWGVCVARTHDIIVEGTSVDVRGVDCEGKFDTSKSPMSVIMTFNEPGSPYRKIRCWDLN